MHYFLLIWIRSSKLNEPAPQKHGCAPGIAGSLATYSRFRSGLSCRCKLRAHLFHKLAHASDMTRRATFDPGFVALRSFFQVREELLIHKPLPSLRDDGLDELPDPEKLAAGLKEEAFVEQTVVEQRAGLLPIAEHHHRERACFRSGRRDSHGILEIVHEVVLEEPIASLAQPGLAAHIIDLQVELRLFVRGFCFHGACLLFFLLFFMNHYVELRLHLFQLLLAFAAVSASGSSDQRSPNK